MLESYKNKIDSSELNRTILSTLLALLTSFSPLNTIHAEEKLYPDLAESYLRLLSNPGEKQTTKEQVFVMGFAEMCAENELICKILSSHNQAVSYKNDFSISNLKAISQINIDVNESVVPREDLVVYGVREKWTVPLPKPYSVAGGDCEDFVLLKIMTLISSGFDPKNISILIVLDKNGDGHALLAKRLFLKGKPYVFVLNNIDNDILSMSEIQKKYKPVAASKVELKKEGDGSTYKIHFYTYK